MPEPIIHPPYPADHPWHGFQLIQEYDELPSTHSTHERDPVTGEYIEPKVEGDGYRSIVIRLSDKSAFGPFKFTGEAIAVMREMAEAAKTPADKDE